MNKFYEYKRCAGITLIEALIAMVVISVGTLSIVKLQTELTAAGGLSKARVVATQLAQEKLEELRNQAVQGDYDALISDDDLPVEIGNAVFEREWTVTDLDDANGVRKVILVSVRWNDPKDGPQVVTLSTVMSWDDPLYSATLAEGALPGGGFIRPPTGGGELVRGDEMLPALPVGAVPNADGTGYTAVVDDQTVLLVEEGSEYRVLMRLRNDEDFSTIGGRIYADSEHFDMDALALSDLYIFTSDAVTCLRTAPDAVGGHYYSDYTCYAGPGWYGNVALFRTGSKDVVERFCVGDPALTIPSEPLLYDNHAQFGSQRSYRAVDPDTGYSVGIGMHNDDGVYDSISYVGHDFLLTEIRTTGQADVDENCQTAMTETGLNFGDNPGRYFCLNDHCPTSELMPGEGVLVTITGTGTTPASLSNVFDANNDNQLNQRFVLEGAECSITRTDGNNYNNSRQFGFESCEIDNTGRGAEPWDATMTFTFEDGYTLCPVTDADDLCVGDNCGTLTFDDSSIYFSDMPHTLDAVNLTINVCGP